MKHLSRPELEKIGALWVPKAPALLLPKPQVMQPVRGIGVSFQPLIGYGGTPASSSFIDSIVTTAADSTTRTMTHNGGVRTGKWAVVLNSRKASSGINVDPASMTFAGTAMSLVVALASGRQSSSLWISTTDITTDGTDDVVATWASVQQNPTQSSLYAVDSLLSTTATATNSGAGGTPTLSVNVNAGGIIIGGACNGSGSAAWTGLTEDVDSPSGTLNYSSASGAFASAGSPQAVSLTQGGTDATAVSASFR